LSPDIYPKEGESFMRIITFALYNTNMLSCVKDIVVNNTPHYPVILPAMEKILYELATLYPPYKYASSPLIQKYHKYSMTQYLTRPVLLRMLVVELFTQPFLFDNLSNQLVKELVIKLPLKDVLTTVSTMFINKTQTLDDISIAGLLMNITELSDVDSGKQLDGIIVSTLFEYF
jgi:hypothetical protein